MPRPSRRALRLLASLPAIALLASVSGAQAQVPLAAPAAGAQVAATAPSGPVNPGPIVRNGASGNVVTPGALPATQMPATAPMPQPGQTMEQFQASRAAASQTAAPQVAAPQMGTAQMAAPQASPGPQITAAQLAAAQAQVVAAQQQAAALQQQALQQGGALQGGGQQVVVVPGGVYTGPVGQMVAPQMVAPQAAAPLAPSPQAAIPATPSSWTAPLAPFPGTIAPGQVPVGPTHIPPQGVQDPAFAAALAGTLPMTPEMILELRRQLDQNQRAAARTPTPSGANPRPAVRSLNLSLAPGGASPIIHTAPRHVTAIVFTDATGQPWPIAAVVNGNPQAFALDAPVRGGSMLAISALAAYGTGNLLVQLEGAATPVVLLLDGSSDRVDMRLDVRVQGRGPNARTEIISRGPAAPETGGASIMAMLDGVPPGTAQPLAIAGVSPDEARAWRVDGQIYLRTRHSVLSPAWSNSVSAADGTTVYELPPTPVVLVSVAGRPISLRLQDR